jgi:hypothetical protein
MQVKTVTTKVTHTVRRSVLLWGMQIALGKGWLTREEYEVTANETR